MKFLLLIERSLLVIFWVLLIFGFDMPYMAILTILSALIHEAGHIICLLIIKSDRSYMPTPNISGFRIKISGMSYKNELLCALAGPLANLVLATVCCFPSPVRWATYLKTFAMLNVMTMISNLLPIEEFDGYKILNAILALTVKCNFHAQKLLYFVSFVFSAAMCFLSLYIILKLGEGYWIFALFFTVMLREVIKKQKGNVF